MENLVGNLAKTELLSTAGEENVLSRLQETILNPALNSGLIEPFNALASSANELAGKELIACKNEFEVSQDKFMSSGWLLSGLSSGLGMLLPYLISGKLAGAALRKAGQTLELRGSAAAFLQHGASAQIAGAAIYDGMRQTKAGETRSGNALAGAAAFGVFEGGNLLTKQRGLPAMLALRAFSGAAGAGVHQTVSSLWSRHELPERNETLKAMLGGMVLNIALPEAQRGLTAAVDSLSMQTGRGVPLDRYLSNRSDSAALAKSRTFSELKEAQPWTRVQTESSSNNFVLKARRIELEGNNPAPEKLGGELARLSFSKNAEPGFSAAAADLNAGNIKQAWQNYSRSRISIEASAREAEARIATELGKKSSTLSKGELAKEITAWSGPGKISFERLFRKEFTDFQNSNGAFRPGMKLSDGPEYIPAELSQSRIKLSAQAQKEFEIASSVVRALQDQGEIALFAGGSVRDEIMGRIPKDYDIASSASPSKLEAIFKSRGYKVLEVGKKFGTVKVIVDGVQIEVTTLRNDGNYSDGRRPDSVEFKGTLTDDAGRRDLTINSIFKDPLTGKYYDLYKGREDIAAGLIRTVGDPYARFAEDHLRMMRVPRFAARYDFRVEENTLAALSANSHKISKVSSERIREELRGILSSPKPSIGLNLMMETGLMKELIPEMQPMNGPKGKQDSHWHPEGNAWEHTKMVVDKLAENGNGGNFPLMLSGLLHDVAKPQTQVVKADGRISNPNHEKVGAEMAGEITRRLSMSRKDSKLVSDLIADHMRMHKVKDMRTGKLAELLKRPEINELIELQNADSTGRGYSHDQHGSHRDWLLAKIAELKNASDPNLSLDAAALVNGRMINEMGFPKAPIRKEILDAARQAQQEGLFASAETGKIWVLDNYGQHLKLAPQNLAK